MNEVEITADDVRREHAQNATPLAHALYLAAVVGGASLLVLALLAWLQAT
jgi:multisubunit Na+/H+ antiporter MnhC subunit